MKHIFFLTYLVAQILKYRYLFWIYFYILNLSQKAMQNLFFTELKEIFIDQWKQ